jgi:hypothetical protein
MSIKKFEAFSQSEIDRILDKINATGMDSLTPGEKQYLNDPEGTDVKVARSRFKTTELPSKDDIYVIIYDSDVQDMGYKFGFAIYLEDQEFDDQASEVLDAETLIDFEENGIEEVSECDFLVLGEHWTLGSLKKYLKGLGFKEIKYNGN